MKDKLVSIGVGLFLLLCLGSLVYVFISGRNKDAHIIELENQLAQQIPLERIDDNTVRKNAVLVSDIWDRVVHTSELVSKIAKERGQEIRYVNSIQYSVRIDTILIKADTVYSENGREFGAANINNEWYDLSIKWSCNPYESVINSIGFRDRISLIGYEKGDEVGVYAVNSNPYSRIDSVSYFFKKPSERNFTAGIGIGTNVDADEIRPILKAGYRHHSIGVSTDLKKIFNEKPVLKDFYFYYIYEF